MRKAEVVIVGGGIIGSSIAYYLSKKSVKVIVIERGKLLSGASGANQGGIPVSLFDPPLLDLAVESRKLYDTLSSELNQDLGFEETGLLLLVLDDEQVPLLMQFKEKIESRGLGAKTINEEVLQSNFLSDDISAAVRTSADASVDPFKVGFGFVNAAKANGVKFFKDEEVQNLNVSNKRITKVVTSRENIKPEYVVNAAGPNSKSIGRMVGLDIPIKPRRGQILVTEPTPEAKFKYLMDFDYLATALEDDNQKNDEREEERLRLGVSASIIQEPSSNWTIGASRDFSGFNKKTTPQTLGHLADRATKFIPDFKKCNVIRSYAGLRPYCYVDGEPILGKVDELDNFYIATGHAGEGITLAPITGKLVAEEICTEEKKELLEHFNYSRLKNKRESSESN